MSNKTEAWIGVDLDGTLAYYDEWKGIGHIGEPIIPIVNLIKNLIEAGTKVKIFTARVGEGEEAIKVIEAWCERELGMKLEVTNVKDFGMICLYDDRCIQVVPNTGFIPSSLLNMEALYDYLQKQD